MEFIPKYCVINTLCLVGKKKQNDEIIGEDCEETSKREKAKFLVERICQYTDLARTANEAGGYVGRSTTA